METDVIRVGLDKLGKELIKEFANELVTQGHKLTGSLINSLRQDILFAPSSFTLAFYGNHYGLYLETGRRKGAKKIPIDVSSPEKRKFPKKGYINMAKMPKIVILATA